MKKEFWVHIAVLITGGIVWSVTAFAYMHNNFVGKDELLLIIQKLDHIDKDIDNIQTYLLNGGN